MKRLLTISLVCLSFLGRGQTLFLQSGADLYIQDPGLINANASPTPTLYVDGGIQNNGNITNNGELQLTGDLTNTGTYISTGDDVFAGAGHQNQSGIHSGSKFYNMVIFNNGNNVNCMSNTDIDQSIQLYNGVLVTNGNLVYLMNTSGIALNGSNVSGLMNNYVNGNIRQDIASGTYTFEVGDATHGNQRATVFFVNTGGATYMDIGYTSTGSGSIAPINIPSGCTGIYDKSTGSWTITPNGVNGTYDYQVTLYPGGANASTLTGSLYDAMQKDGVFANNPCAGTLGNTTSDFLNSFSTFRMLGGPTLALNAEIVDFNGRKLQYSDLLSWSTLNEHNSLKFNVAHSKDGMVFNNIGSVNSKAPNGNSSSVLNYELEHPNPVLGHNYYRLEQVDIDGNTSVHSRIVDLIWNSNLGSVTVYPNPANDNLNVDVYSLSKSKLVVKLQDMSGRTVRVLQTEGAEGVNNIKMDISDIASGVYTINVLSNDKVLGTMRITKQD